MIIKLTVKDNDYSSVLEEFAKTLFMGLMLPDDELNDAEWREASKKKEGIRLLLNPNYTSKLTKEQEEMLEDEIFKLWVKYISTRYPDVKEELNLRNSFKSSVGFSFKDKWENGEAVYLFTNGNFVLTQ